MKEMTDREKVIKGLQYCFTTANCDGCPYEIECRKILFKTSKNHCPILDDALALLKEQEEEIQQLQTEELYWCIIRQDGINKVVVASQTPLTDEQTEELFWCIEAMQRSGKTLKDLLKEREANSERRAAD